MQKFWFAWCHTPPCVCTMQLLLLKGDMKSSTASCATCVKVGGTLPLFLDRGIYSPGSRSRPGGATAVNLCQQRTTQQGIRTLQRLGRSNCLSPYPDMVLKRHPLAFKITAAPTCIQMLHCIETRYADMHNESYATGMLLQWPTVYGIAYCW